MTAKQPLRAFALSVLLAAVALALAQVTFGLFGGAYLYFPLVAVFVSALHDGLWPGFVTVGLCALGFDFFFLGPPLQLGVATSEEAHRLVGFILFGGASAWIAARFQAARRGAEEARILAEEASDEARRVGALQERLVAVVSHDLRNPLGALRAGLHLLPRLGALSERQEVVLARMHGTVKRMDALIEDLLDVARTRHGETLPIHAARAQLGAICARVIGELEEGTPDARVVLSVEGDDAALLDEARLAQLVSNLVGNAIAHGTSAAPVEVRVRGDGERLLLEVENRGSPIPDDLVPHLFEPFQRGRADGGGLGLGLFIVREIARAHGGSVGVRSDLAATVFEVRLPRERALRAM
jgi:signal transduction histidine kinase